MSDPAQRRRCRRETDVVVVGGGPAGAAAAIAAAQRGLRVILLERQPSARLAPGESLHPGVQPILRTLGVEQQVLDADFMRYPGHVVRWRGTEEFQPFGQDEQGPWLGFHALRQTFDAILLQRAVQLGVTVIRGCSVRDVLIEDAEVVAVETDAGTIRAAVTIDATGRRRFLQRQLRIPWEQRGPRRYVWYAYADTTIDASCGAQFDMPRLIADSGGWTWLARVGHSTVQCTRYNFSNTRPPGAWFPDDLLDRAPLRVQCRGGADVTWGRCQFPAGRGYYCVGDAAAVLDPLSSHGVLKSLMSGIFAAACIADTLHSRAPRARAAAAYADWTRRWFEHDAFRLTAMYAQSGAAS